MLIRRLRSVEEEILYEEKLERYRGRTEKNTISCSNCKSNIEICFKVENISLYGPPLLGSNTKMIEYKQDYFYCPRCSIRYGIHGEIVSIKMTNEVK